MYSPAKEWCVRARASRMPQLIYTQVGENTQVNRMINSKTKSPTQQISHLAN